MPDSTLNAIRTKVRRLTRSMSEAQLTTAQLDEYINTFVVFDFPQHLRTFNLETTFTFYTNPYQDKYATDTISFAGVTTNPLYDFQNKYTSVEPPVYVAGFQSVYAQSREQFYNIYPFVNSIASIGRSGDGATTTFSGVINAQNANVPPNTVQNIALLQNNVTFSAVATNGQGLVLVDVPVVNTTTGYNSLVGNLYIPGSQPATPPTVVDPNNFINYMTGVFTITFPVAPAAGVLIYGETVPQNLSIPQAVLYYDNTFYVRPVPDKPYPVNIQAFIKPVELLAQDQHPKLKEWWQFIAYGAAKKVFQDRMDDTSLAIIETEYKEQESLCLRSTLMQITTQRTATIYTDQTGTTNNGWFGWGGWSN